MRETMHTIKFVAQHTGLSAHTIRAWERRYAALSPERTATNRRLYSTDDMEKLSLLRRAVQAGHNIGQIARLSLSDLQRLLAQNEALEAERVPARRRTVGCRRSGICPHTRCSDARHAGHDRSGGAAPPSTHWRALA